MVSVNTSQCKATGEILKKFTINKKFLNRKFISVESDPEKKTRAFFYVVAICHQTYSLSDPKRNLYGWDFLEDRFHNLIITNSPFLESGFFHNSTLNEIKIILRNLFSTDDNKEYCSLDRLDERSNFLKETDEFFLNNFSGSPIKYLESTEDRFINNGKGLYETLSRLQSFSDPFNKKISFLVKLLEDANLIKVSDYENFRPIMDYHMQRVLMRLGCIEINNIALYNDLIKRNKVEDDSEVRKACISAIEIISRQSGHNAGSMNDFFWPLGRSCCNEKPLCRTGKCEKEPCSLSQVIDIRSKHKNCIFDDICKGKNNDHYLNLWQPNIETHYY